MLSVLATARLKINCRGNNVDNRTNIIKENWNEMSDRWNDLRSESIVSGIKENPYSIFRPQLKSMMKRFIGDFNNKRILVPASGDNREVFAFHLLGAKVTSSDLSEKQLENSAEIAAKNGWDIEFIQDDLRLLSQIKSGEYDIVYISNGVMIWIDDLNSMYKNINRVLKSHGYYMMYDAHPFMFPFDTNDTAKLTLRKDYSATGPFGKFEIYNWRLQDIINSMVSASLILVHMEEMNAEHGTFWVDWDKAHTIPSNELNKYYNSKTNPLYALPQAISLCARKVVCQP